MFKDSWGIADPCKLLKQSQYALSSERSQNDFSDVHAECQLLKSAANGFILQAMTASNPFADESRAAAERRERSERELANPYAAPPGGPDYQAETGPGVGIWRLHEQVVIHQALDLPERCIYTNEPGVERRTLKLSWYASFGLSFYSIKFAYSLSDAGVARRSKELFGPITMLGVGYLLLLLELVFGGQDAMFGLSRIPVIGFIGAVVALKGYISSNWRILQLVHREGPYFVLSGAGPAFVRSLPPWPGLLASRL